VENPHAIPEFLVVDVRLRGPVSGMCNAVGLSKKQCSIIVVN